MPHPYIVGITDTNSTPLVSGTTVPLPPHQENDILVFVGSSRSGNTSALSGFTQQILHTNGTRSFTVYLKRAGAAETDPTITVAGSTNRGYWLVVRGVTDTGTFVEASASATRASSLSSQTLPSVTSTSNNAGILTFWCSDNTIDPTAWDIDGSGGGRRVVRQRETNSGVAVGWDVVDAAGAYAGSVTLGSASVGSVGQIVFTAAASAPEQGTVPSATYAATPTNLTGSSPTVVTLPTTAAAGDLIVIFYTSRVSGSLTATGFEFIEAALASSPGWSGFLYGTAAGGETSVSVSWTFQTSKASVLPVVVDQATLAGASYGVAEDAGTNQASKMFPGTVGPGRVIAALAANNNTSVSSWSTSVAGTVTEQVDWNEGGSNARWLAVGDDTVAADGDSIGEMSWTNPTSIQGGFMILVAQGPSAAPTPPAGGARTYPSATTRRLVRRGR